MVKLLGIFSRIDDKQRLVIVFLDDDNSTRQKLANTCGKFPYKPYTHEDFTLTMPKWAPSVENATDITSLIGLRVQIHATPIPYKFVSPAAKNKGEFIEGTRLVLESIKQIGT